MFLFEKPSLQSATGQFVFLLHWEEMGGSSVIKAFHYFVGFGAEKAASKLQETVLPSPFLSGPAGNCYGLFSASCLFFSGTPPRSSLRGGVWFWLNWDVVELRRSVHSGVVELDLSSGEPLSGWRCLRLVGKCFPLPLSLQQHLTVVTFSCPFVFIVRYFGIFPPTELAVRSLPFYYLLYKSATKRFLFFIWPAFFTFFFLRGARPFVFCCRPCWAPSAREWVQWFLVSNNEKCWKSEKRRGIKVSFFRTLF